MLKSYYQDIEKYLQPNHVLVIYGPRQVGKTTLLENFLSGTRLQYKLDSGDNIKVRQILGSQDFSVIKEYVSGYDLLAIDEAQRIPNVGMGLKIIVDQVPNIKVIATGSSSFELAGQIGEPLTGRKKTITLYPLSQIELSQLYKNRHEITEKLPEWLVFGTYPAVLTAKTKDEKMLVLEEILNSYLLKDILELDKIKRSKALFNLLRLMAFQVGSEVSLSELAKHLGIDYKTVGRYLDLLEKAFVIFSLSGFSKNLQKEITRKQKYYFFDTGIRNAIISNFNGLELRDDIGKLWENFLAVERLKAQEYKGIFSNNYFWRTWDQKEIDWLEEREGKLFAYEFKYKKDKAKIPKDFLSAYPEAETQIITIENYLDFTAC